jgi:hypothetical protein
MRVEQCQNCSCSSQLQKLFYDTSYFTSLLFPSALITCCDANCLRGAELSFRSNRFLALLKLKSHYERQSVGQSVLVSGAHLGPATKFFFLLEIFFRHLRVCYFVTPSLTRGRVCNLLYNCFWALPEQKSCRTHDHILLSHLSLPQPGGPRIYIPQEQGDPVIPLGTGFPLRRLLRLTGLRWRYSNPPPHRLNKFPAFIGESSWPELASELYRPSDRRLSAKLVPTLAAKRCHVVSVTGPYGRILPKI